MKSKCLAALLIFALVGPATVAPAAEEWTGTPEQKIWGLMTVWAQVKYTFPHFDNRPDLDWDETVRETLPRAMAAADIDAYYDVLLELVARLEDGHTRIMPPWGHIKPGHDLAPVEVRILDGRFFIDRVGEDPKLAAGGLVPGSEILQVDGTPVAKRFADHVMRFHRGNTPQGSEAFNSVYLLEGPATESVAVTFRTPEGVIHTVDVERNALGGEYPFMTRLVANALVATTITSRELPDGIIYVEIPNFDHRQAADDFVALIEGLDPARIRGLIIDLRYNAGGSDALVHSMVARLIDEPVSTPISRFRHFVGADVAWGKPPRWETSSRKIEPAPSRRWSGPVVILTGGLTNSSAEDFAIELRAAGRATLVGQTTAGSAGNALRSELPGGGELLVSTFTALLPDTGEEYVGVGVVPDEVVVPTPADLAAGRDVVLERAVTMLRD